MVRQPYPPGAGAAAATDGSASETFAVKESWESPRANQVLRPTCQGSIAASIHQDIERHAEHGRKKICLDPVGSGSASFELLEQMRRNVAEGSDLGNR
jgi:hypothetical protein